MQTGLADYAAEAASLARLNFNIDPPRGSDLGLMDLRGADLVNAVLWNANLVFTRLDGSILRGADLFDAKLGHHHRNPMKRHGAYLVGADLTDARLWSANLCHVNLRGADLTRTELGHADLRGADLTDAELRGAKLDHARGLTQTQIDSARGDDDLAATRAYPTVVMDRLKHPLIRRGPTHRARRRVPDTATAMHSWSHTATRLPATDRRLGGTAQPDTPERARTKDMHRHTKSVSQVGCGSFFQQVIAAARQRNPRKLWPLRS